MKKLIFTAALLLAAGASGFADAKHQSVPADTAVRTGKLSNGLTYYIRHNDLPEERANFYIAQRVGSILEEESQRGLAHFLEHMAFAGTKHFPDKALTNYLEQNGIKFGANLNAYTSIDETVYNINDVPTLRPGLVDSCLLILHDWSGLISLEGDAIDRERKIIHEEWRTRSNASRRMYDSLLPKLYPGGSRYADRMPIGLMEVVDNFPHKELRDYYEKWYRPDLQAIIVVGDINPDSIETRIRTLWKDIPRRKHAAGRRYFPVEDNAAPIVAVATDPEATSASITVFYKHDRPTREQLQSTEGLDNSYIQGAFALMLNGRLRELTQRVDPPFVYAGFYDSYFSVSKTKMAYQLSISFKDDAWRRAMDAAVAELKRAREYGFTEAEYRRAQAEMNSYFENQYKERDKMRNGSYIQQCLGNFLNDQPLVSAEYLYQYYRKRTPEITLDSVNGIFRTMFPEHNIALVLTAPAKDSLDYPTEKELVDAYRQAYDAKVAPYEENLGEGGLLEKEPQPGTIVSEETDPDYGTTVWTLGNGARVVIKPTDFKSDEILFEAVSPGGTSSYPRSDSLYMNLQAGAAIAGGLGRYNLIDLGKKLAGKQVSVDPFVSSTSEGITGSCTPKDFDEMLQLTHLLFTAPRRDTAQYGAFASRIRSILANREANPSIALIDSTNRMLYGDSPRYRRLTAQRFDQIEYDRLIELYLQRFANAADFTFVFVGNIDPQNARQAVERYIGSLPGTPARETAQAVDFILPGSRTLSFDKAMSTPKSTVMIQISGPERYTLKDQIEATFLKHVMDIVYTETIRTEEGGTYGVGTQVSLLQEPYDQFIFSISFDTNDSLARALSDRVLAELKKVADGGPSKAAFDKVKEYLLKGYAQSIRENSYWREHIVSFYRYGVNSHKEYLNTLNAVTPEDIARTARKIYDSPNRVEVIMNGVAKTQ